MTKKMSRRVPWWMFVIAALFAADFGLQTYCRNIARLQFGYTARSEDGLRVVDQVDPGGSAERAGLEAGDVILAIEGRDIRVYSTGMDWVFRTNLQSHGP